MKKKSSQDSYTDPADANAEPCLAQDSLSLFLHRAVFVVEGWNLFFNFMFWVGQVGFYRPLLRTQLT